MIDYGLFNNETLMRIQKDVVRELIIPPLNQRWGCKKTDEVVIIIVQIGEAVERREHDFGWPACKGTISYILLD